MVEEKEITKFYNSAAWKWTRRAKLMRDPLCQACLMSQVVTPANEVHHLKPIRLFWSERFEGKLLLSLCTSCHMSMEIEIREQEEAKGYTGWTGNH